MSNIISISSKFFIKNLYFWSGLTIVAFSKLTEQTNHINYTGITSRSQIAIN